MEYVYTIALSTLDKNVKFNINLSPSIVTPRFCSYIALIIRSTAPSAHSFILSLEIKPSGVGVGSGVGVASGVWVGVGVKVAVDEG